MRLRLGNWVVLAGMLAVLVTASGCSWSHHRSSRKCREPAMPSGLANGSGLAVPPGLDAPDQRGAARIPQLKAPEQPRSASDPCLSTPPNYATSQP
jgi:hypothetical protein